MQNNSILKKLFLFIIIFSISCGTSYGAARGIASRGGTESAINNGTKVTTAAQNTVGGTCQEKFNGCMDAFCMMDNEDGGRCICSDQIFELNKQKSEIDNVLLSATKLATSGETALETARSQKSQVRSRGRVDLSAWDSVSQTDAEDTNEKESDFGTAKFVEYADVCIEKMPECKSNFDFIKTMYNQQIKSDCMAYKNALKDKSKSSNEKLATAQRALRTTAHNQLTAANKYDLGQCTVEFRKCMQETGGCGTDFSACVGSGRGIYKISGPSTQIDISSGTYSILSAKKPLCESVTKSCVAVADQVWDTFLRESAVSLKNAELIAENKTRQDCIGNVSDCFLTACKDNIDPNDPDGSYDMCLTRPASMLSFCKNDLKQCGVDASSEKTAEKSQIWDYVLARLASMRVDSCTTAVKECMQSDDRCGADYSQCVGLDTDTIIRMCPYDKLTGCQQKYGETDVRGDAVYDALSSMITGLMVNIDNELLSACQNAVDEAMIRVCGNTTNCNNLTVNTANLGANSLDYKICEYALTEDRMFINYESCYSDATKIPDTDLGRVVGSKEKKLGPVKPLLGTLDGTIYWNLINFDENGVLTTVDEYFEIVDDDSTMTEMQRDRINNEISLVQRNINSAIDIIESDPTVQYCMTGREVQGMKKLMGNQVPRFPNLTKQTRMLIANSALDIARNNYYTRYNELSEKQLKDKSIIAERQAEILGENGKDALRDSARQSCVALAEISAMPRSLEPPKSRWGEIIVAAVIVAAIIVASIFTFGGAAAAGAAAGAAVTATTASSSLGVAAAAGTTAMAAATAGSSVAVGVAATTTAMGMAAAGMTGIGAAAAGTIGAFLGASTLTASIALGATVISGIAAAAGGLAFGATTLLDNNVVFNETKTENQEMTGHFEIDSFDFKEEITTTFNMDTMNCEKCTVSYKCEKIKNPPFGQKHCVEWAKPSKKCTDIQF